MLKGIERYDFSKQLSVFYAGALLISLPFDRFYVNIVLTGWLIHLLIYKRKSAASAFKNKHLRWVQSVFWVTVLCTIHSEDSARALSFWERQLPILLLPVLIFSEYDVIKSYKEKLFFLFASLCTFLVLYLYADAFRTIVYYNLGFTDIFSSRFINHNFSLPIDIHASYLSVYLFMSFAFLVVMLQDTRSQKSILLYSLMLLMLTAGIIQLGSRSVFFAFLLLLNLVLPIYVAKNIRLRTMIISILVSAALLLPILLMSNLHERFISDLKDDISRGYPAGTELTDTRKQRWDVVYELIAASPITGYGTGMETSVLREAYFQNKLYHSYLHRLNAHNQYLSFLIKGGPLALIVYISVLFAGLIIAFRKKDLCFTGFLLLVIIMSFGENLLDVNRGIVFYAFFFSIFLAGYKKSVPAGVVKGQPLIPATRFIKLTNSSVES